MAAQVFAAIDVGSFELEMGIYELSGKNGSASWIISAM